jgi:hypothetical protein
MSVAMNTNIGSVLMRMDGEKLLSPFAAIMATVTAVTALLALMKLAGVIAASWLWVLSPIWGALALIALAGLGAFLFVLRLSQR